MGQLGLRVVSFLFLVFSRAPSNVVVLLLLGHPPLSMLLTIHPFRSILQSVWVQVVLARALRVRLESLRPPAVETHTPFPLFLPTYDILT